jgi:DNA-binding beta-propeller fold protein YncE
MRWLATLFLPSVLLSAVVSTRAQGVLLVSYNAEHKVAAIDLATGKALATFPSPRGPHEITVSHDGAKAYISDTGTGPGSAPGDAIVVLNLKKRIIEATLQVCEQPHDTRVSQDGRRLWVACAPVQAVQEIDATSGEVYKSWKTGRDGGWFVEVTPDGRKIYVPHLEGKALSVIDRRTGSVRTLLLGTTQFGISISPDGREVWVSDADKKQISIVDSIQDAVTGAVSLGSGEKDQSGFSRMRFTPDGRHVVVVLGSKFIVVDTKRRSIAWSIDMTYPGKVVTVSGDSRRAFVSHPGHDRVSAIDLKNRRIEKTVPVGKQPDGLAWVKPF